MLNFKKILILCAGLLSMHSAIFAEGIAVGGRVGTLGLGLEATVGILPSVNGRLGINKFNYNYDGTESDVDYDIDLKLDSWDALADWYVLGGTFHLTGGILFNKNKLDVNASLESGKSYDIGDARFTNEQIGKLTGTLDFDKSALYLGMGWGNPVEKDSSFSINFDLGLVLQGSPHAKLRSTGGDFSDNAIFKENLAKEEADLEDAVDSFKYYPVLELGIAFHF